MSLLKRARIQTDYQFEYRLTVYNYTGTSFGGIDPLEWRDPPPPPTAVTFPAYLALVSDTGEKDPLPPQHLESIFARVVRPTDISMQHLQALNIQLCPPSTPAELFENTSSGEDFLPPTDHQKFMPLGRDELRKLTADAKQAYDYALRMLELDVENDDAFRVITKTSKPDSNPPKLAHLRKFWHGLENMSQFWDSSLDEYSRPSPLPDEELPEEHDSKRQRFSNTDDSSRPFGKEHGSISTANVQTKPASDESETEAAEDNDRRYTNAPSHLLDAINLGTNKPSPSSDPSRLPDAISDGTASPTLSGPVPDCPRYRGRRTAAGREMPDRLRTDILAGLVEAAGWPYTNRVHASRRQPFLQIGNLNFPVTSARQVAWLFKAPSNLEDHRKHIIEGPIFGIQSRVETDFSGGSSSDQDGRTRVEESKAVLDTIREVGFLLQLAQERRREGKQDVQPGLGKWWSEKPRWGGDRVSKEEFKQDFSTTSNDQASDTGKSTAHHAWDLLSSVKTQTPYEKWAELHPPKSKWDPRHRYRAIGKDKSQATEEESDDVFILSSINHHVSVVRLTVSGQYLDCLTSGREVLSNSPPVLRRTQWYDLFDRSQRCEAFRVLWAVFAYLNRNEVFLA